MSEPSPLFEALHRIDLDIEFNRYCGDERRVAAELWCCYNTQHRWFRRTPTDFGIARFEFEEPNEAPVFRLAHKLVYGIGTQPTKPSFQVTDLIRFLEWGTNPSPPAILREQGERGMSAVALAKADC
ncbi:MAG: hypothetical protein P4L64_06970 [Caulobacteraceae bacterium]|nr:hypothetical protein [Caulobacteraceae bacterium]